MIEREKPQAAWPTEGCSLAEARERTSDRDLWREYVELARRHNAFPRIIAGFARGRDLLRERHALYKAMCVPESKIYWNLRELLALGGLVATGRPNDITQQRQLIPADVWRLLRIDFNRSSAHEWREGGGGYVDVRVYPVLKAPCAISLITGQPLIDVVRRYVLEDPEVAALTADAIAVEPAYESFLSCGQCLSKGNEDDLPFEDVAKLLDQEVIDPVGFLVSRGLPLAVARAAVAFLDRLSALIGFLQRGDLVAKGVHNGSIQPVSTSIWSPGSFWLDLEAGDVVENSSGQPEVQLTRWSGVVLEHPASSAAVKGGKAKRPTPRQHEVLEAAHSAGIDLFNPRSKPTELGREIGPLLTTPPRTPEAEVALAQTIRRMREKGRPAS